MAVLGKWIDGLTGDGPVTDAARRSLEARLAAVVHWLPLAADGADEDVERVHQLRVSTRRAIAALTLYEDWLPPRRAKRLAKRLKQIRRAAGAARDLDVLGERLDLQAGELCTLITEHRAAAQPGIKKIARRCMSKAQLARRIERVLGRIRPRGAAAKADDSSFRDWAAGRLQQAATQFFDATPDGIADLAAFHRFRIAGKRLRYTIELVAPAFGPELRKETYPIVEKLQDRLGTVNDHVTARGYLADWNRAADAGDARDLLERVDAREATEQQEAISAFDAWWTPERAAALRRGLGSPQAM